MNPFTNAFSMKNIFLICCFMGSFLLSTQTYAQTVAGNNSPICIGNSLQLTVNTQVGATYFWQGPNGFSSSLQNPFIQQAMVQNAGMYTVFVTINSQTQQATTLVQILQGLFPGAGSNSPVCPGATINLSANNIAGATYSWSGPGGFFSGLNAPSISNAQSIHSGVYTVTLSKPGCTTATGTTSVTVSNQGLNLQAGSNSPVCTGSTLHLSANTIQGANYFWAGPSGFSSTQQNPTLQNTQIAASGQYTLTVTLNGCTAAQIIPVTVINAPTASPGSNSPVCAGQTLNLSTNPIQGAQYSWRGPNGFSTSIQNPVIQNAQTIHSGIYTLTVSINGCINSTVQTISVVVNPGTNINAGSNSPVCTGSTLNLTAGSVQGGSYFWTGPNGFTSNQQNPVLPNANPQMNGLYLLTISNTPCGTITRQVQVQVNSIPQIQAGNNGPICTGGVLNLYSQMINGAQYVWLGPNGFSSTLSTVSITNAQTIHAGTYTLNVTLPGCSTLVSTTTVIINQGNTNNITAGSNSPICAGQTLQLTVTSIPGASYYWTGPMNFSSTQQNTQRPQITQQQGGTYMVNINIPGCGSRTISVPVIIQPGPVSQASSNSPVCTGGQIRLSANPVMNGLQYIWAGPNGFSSTLPSPSISNAQSIHAGSYTLTVISPNCGSSTSVTQVIVNPSLNTIQANAGSNSPVCTGSTLNLSATTIPGATYFWTGPLGFTSNQQNPVRTNATQQMNGVYTVQISGAGCGIITRQVVVNVNSGTQVQVYTNSPICAGQTLYFSTSGSQNAFYQWAGPSGFSFTGPNPVIQNITPNQSGVYTLWVSVPGCGTSSTTTTVVVNQGPGNITAGSNSPVCSGGTLNLSATQVTGATYSWTGPGGFTSNLRTPVRTNVTPQMGGIYYVIISTPGCGSVTRQISVTIGSSPVVQTSSNSPLCSGQTLNLSATQVSGATYIWIGPGGFSSNLRTPSRINVNPNMAGTYTLIVSVPGCGSSTSTVQVTINQNSTSVNTGSNSPVCTGGTLNLSTSTVQGGTYLWTGPAGFSSTQQNPTRTNVTTQMAGVYTLTITGSPCGTIVRTLQVMVNSPLQITAGSNSPVCAGGLLQLTAGPVNNNTQYFWSGPNGFSNGGSTILIQQAQTHMSGTYTVWAHTPGCGMQQQTVQVNVVASPMNINAGGNSPVCLGSTLILTGTQVTGGTSYWTGPAGYSAMGPQAARQQMTPNYSGLYTYTVNTPGCGSAVRYVNVTVNDPASAYVWASVNPICDGNTLVLNASAPPGSTFMWSGPGGFTSPLQNAWRTNMQNAQAGVYSCVIQVPGCGPVNRSIQVTVLNCRTTSSEDLAGSLELNVYPNPFTQYVQGSAMAGKIRRISLMDITGRQVAETEVDFLGNFNIPAEHLNSGTYFLKFETYTEETGIIRLFKQ